MRIEARLLIGVGMFFAVILGLYWFTSYEDAGTVMLLFSLVLGVLPGSYLLWWSRRMQPRPEDRDDAELADGAGAVGAFPNQSIWPFVFAMGCAGAALALVFGLWLAILGGGLVFLAAAGYVVESRRGGMV
jgi:hypothetical protein